MVVHLPESVLDDDAADADEVDDSGWQASPVADALRTYSKYDARATTGAGGIAPRDVIRPTDDAEPAAEEVIVDLREQPAAPVRPADERTFWQRRSAHLPRLYPDD
jgi:hypothetical protein